MTLEKQLREAEHFKVEGGPALPSLLALRSYLRMMPQSQFDHHVGSGKNDFAAWIEHVFGERELAKRISASRTREEMVWCLDDAFSETRMAKVIAGQEIAPQHDAAPGAADPVPLQEDAAFDGQKQAIIDGNERISAKYDEIAKHLQEAIANTVPKEVEQRIERLRARQQEIAARISEARKAGHDALIPALVMRGFGPKLSLAIATREEHDFASASAVLDAAERELKEVDEERIIDIKKEVLALAGIEKKQA